MIADLNQAIEMMIRIYGAEKSAMVVSVLVGDLYSLKNMAWARDLEGLK